MRVLISLRLPAFTGCLFEVSSRSLFTVRRGDIETESAKSVAMRHVHTGIHNISAQASWLRYREQHYSFDLKTHLSVEPLAARAICIDIGAEEWQKTSIPPIRQ